MRLLYACTILLVVATATAADYHPITPTASSEVITLTGHDLTIDQLIAVARYGARVQYSPDALQHAAEARDLRAEAGAENIPVYGLNRGSGALREVKSSEAHPADTQVLPMLGAGALPEIADEDLVRAVLLISANTAPLGPAAPETMQMLLDLLNDRITPVAYSRGALGEADFPAVSYNIGATMSGHGEVYYKGVRMKAAKALSEAGLKPLARTGVFGGGAENAYGDARAALLVADGQRVLEWADLTYALDKIGMNSSVTPMVTPVQAQRPFKWVNWDAARVMDILAGSYLFEDDPKRILQDPESMRAAYIRQGAAWQAWAALRDSVVLQINSADLNPMVIVGASPSDSWELATPQMLKYYVKGGPLSHGQHGYVFSTANWDPYPMANDVEAFTNALANMDVAVAQRIERFTDRSPTPFFTGIKPADVLTPDQLRKSPALSEPFWVFMDLWQEIQSLSTSLVPEGNATDVGVADIEGQTRLKGARGQQVVDLTFQLLGYDLWNATYWMDLRKIQDPSRSFGAVPTAVWNAFRQDLPWQQEPEARPEVPYGLVAYQFLKSVPARRFYPGGPAMPATDVHSVHAQQPAPHPDYDPRNFDGVWHLAQGGKFGPVKEKNGVKYVEYPFTPKYEAIYDKRLADAAAGNPYQTAGTTCLPSGAVRLLTGGGPPLEIFHTPTKVAILKQNGGWSRIYLNRPHLPPEDLYPMFYGDSIGHWEDNTLVVDTISLGGADNIDGTAPHSEAAHLVQRISRPSFDTLRVEATLEDSKALAHPVTAVAILKPLPDEDFTEEFCTNERNIRGADGKQTVKPK